MSCPGFGEVNIPSSRAFWDDCEEDEIEHIGEPEKLELKFERGVEEHPLPSNLLLIIEGAKVSEFAKGVFLSDNNIKQVCAIPSKNSALYFNAMTGQLLSAIDEDLTNSGEVTQLLIPYAKAAKQVLTFTLRPKVDYKSENINKYSADIAIVRGIGANTEGVEELEAPNFIVGVAAGVATWCEQAGLQSSSYVVYVDKLPVDALAAQPILQLLKKLGVSCSASYSPPRKDISHLYV